MSCCPPSCAIPTCPSPCCGPCCGPCSYPVGGLGSLDCCPPSCCSSSCCPPSCCAPSCCPPSCCSPSCGCGCGCSTSARCLGMTSGASVSCLNQLPPSEVTIQPPPVTVVMPGAVLTATCESVKVGGYTACAGCPPCGCVCKPC